VQKHRQTSGTAELGRIRPSSLEENRGYQREKATRFIAFRSHWGFQAEFCTPGEGHE
jgi:hypothetical protein